MMIRVSATDLAALIRVVTHLRGAGVDVTAAGGNELYVPDGTDRQVLAAVAGLDVTVHTDLSGGIAAAGGGGAPGEPGPARRTHRTTRKTRTDGE